VIAIDGAAGSGKSTLARGIARALGTPYLNTGLMYRALTRAAIESGVDLDDGDALADLMQGLSFTLGRDAGSELQIQGSPPSPELEGPGIDASVSRAARHPQVRAMMRRTQRALGLRGAVVEGRDIGSVVFPDAPVKIFLTADAVARAARRAGERPDDEASVAEALRERDAKDARVHPFEATPDAVVLDTGRLGVDEALEVALALVRDRLAEADP
jgi:cytidylate kinase